MREDSGRRGEEMKERRIDTNLSSSPLLSWSLSQLKSMQLHLSQLWLCCNVHLTSDRVSQYTTLKLRPKMAVVGPHFRQRMKEAVSQFEKLSLEQVRERDAQRETENDTLRFP